MKKLTPTLLAALLLIGLCWQAPKEAQNAPAGSEGLKARADAVKDALLSGTPEELFAAFAPWLRGRAELFKSEFAVDIGAQDDEELRQAMLNEARKHDPADILELKEATDVQNLTAAQQVGLWLKYYTLRDEKFSAARKDAKWLEVDRQVTTKSVGKDETKIAGTVTYMSPETHNTITVNAVRQDGAWYVEGLDCAIGSLVIDSAKSPLSEDILKLADIEKETFLLKRSEGVHLMAAARDWCRVEYAKKEIYPKNLSDSIELEDFVGHYFRVRDKVYKKPDANRGALVAEPVDDDSLGFGVLYFDYGNGETEIKWYDSKADLDEALKNFQTAK